MKQTPAELVLFDLDGTLLEGDSELAWSAFLAEHGFLDAAEQQREQARFEAAYGAGTLDAETFLDLHLWPVRALRNRPRAWFDCWNERFQHEVIAPMIRPAARELVAQHQAEDALVALVTATNDFLTAPIARSLGIAHLVATELEVARDGRFTGRSRGQPAFREGKIARVHSWLAARDLNWEQFEVSRFYSDSCNDLPLLRRVSHPVAVTPDATLHAEARREGWPVLLFDGA